MRKLMISAAAIAAIAAIAAPAFAVDFGDQTGIKECAPGHVNDQGWSQKGEVPGGEGSVICVQGYNLKSASESETGECGNGQSKVTVNGIEYTIWGNNPANPNGQQYCYEVTPGAGGCTYTGPSGNEQNAEQKLSSLCPAS